MNRIFLIGNLTKDPELKSFPTAAVCNFTLAVNNRNGGSEEKTADFFNVSVWGSKGECCQKYLRKGSKTAVSGSLHFVTTEKEGVRYRYANVVADEVEFLTKLSTTSEDHRAHNQLAEEDFPKEFREKGQK